MICKSGWTCIDENNSLYSVGSILSNAGYLNLYTKNQQTTSVKFKSNFEVKSGDRVELDLETCFTGDQTYFDQAASMSWAQLIAENGEILLDIDYDLTGYSTSGWGSDYTFITDETAGKLTLYVGVEGTGTRYVNAKVDSICVEINSDEM